MRARLTTAGSLWMVAAGALVTMAGCGAEDADPVGAGPSGPRVGSRAAAVERIKKALPTAQVKSQRGQVSRVYGTSLVDGATPGAAAEAFRRRVAPGLGIQEAELEPVALRGGRRQVTAAARPLQLMYDRNSGQYKFSLYRYRQARNGVPVFRGGLVSLVKNTGNHPVVWAGSSVRDLQGFTPRRGGRTPSVDGQKSLGALRARTDSLGNPLPPPSRIDRFTAPEEVIYAGVGSRPATPRLAITYVGETDSPPGKWRFVADAATGDVLHTEDLILFEDVVGNVSGNATEGSRAAECAAEVLTAFPHAEVSIVGGVSALADASGDYVLENAGTSVVDVVSSPLGMYFDVNDYGAAPQQLSLSTVPPGPADFVHNVVNDTDAIRAQTNGYVHANQVREFLLGYVPDYPTIATQLNFPVSVNRTDLYCPGNAWYDGTSINFCVGSASYTNTSFASINHHEYGHHIVEMGGSGQGAYGEGMADVVAMLIAGEPGLAHGFFLNDCASPLRTADNDCQYSATSCSTCGSQSHACGQLLSGVIWDIREALLASDPENGADIINALALNSVLLHTGTGIDDSIAVDLLTLDDDDGNLDNGTPHRTEICAGFELHGMQCPALLTGLSVNPDSDLHAEGPVGGPFEPASTSYTLENLGPEPTIDYQVTLPGGEPWLIITNGAGALAMGQTAQVTVAIDQAVAASLAKGGYDATVSIANSTDGIGDTSRQVTLEVGAPVPVFSETFEDGLGAFSLDAGTTNLWHVTSACASANPGHSLPQSLYYGQDSTCNYNTGTNSGTVTSSPISILDTSVVRLRFNYFLGTEQLGSYDAATAQVSVNGGAFTTVAGNKAGEPLQDGTGSWQPIEVDLTPLVEGISTATLQLRFGFATLDSVANAYAGFLVDDVEILAHGGACSGDADCDDGQYCNGAETCSNDSCVPGTPVACDDGVDCTLDSCDEQNDACVSAPDDASCDDGAACNGAEVCDPVLDCQPGTPLDCDDGIACTVDGCDDLQGCVHAPDSSVCSDGQYCNGTEICSTVAGCQPGSPVDCDDGVDCTLDSCDEQNDACASSPDDSACDDGSSCTDDACTPAGCEFTDNGTCDCVDDSQCDDNNECTADSCTNSVCENVPTSGACTDDGDSCTDDVCSAGVCTHPDNGTCGEAQLQPYMLDGNCDAQSCRVHLMIGNESEETVDLSQVTLRYFIAKDASSDLQSHCDWAQLGCGNLGRAIEVLADPTDDATHALQVSFTSGSLASGATTGPMQLRFNHTNWAAQDCYNDFSYNDSGSYQPVNNIAVYINGVLVGGTEPSGGPTCTSDGECDDSNECTVDTCTAGACVYDSVTCSDGNVCTDDSCAPAIGCEYTDNAVSCDDGDACTEDDVCFAGTCGGAAVNCDDGNACTDDSCAPTTGCESVPNTDPCDDGNACTTQDACAAGECTGAPVNCDDGVDCTTDSCSPQSGCSNVPSDALCDDGVFCNGAETCGEAAGCQPGVAVDCSDGIDCTADSCDEAGQGCENTPDHGACADGLFCNGMEVCDLSAGCQSGPLVDCDDGVDCTVDSCNESEDSCESTPDDSACNDDNVCTDDSCDQIAGCQWSANSSSCDDGDACTTGDACSDGVCSGSALDCDDGDACTVDTCDAAGGCDHEPLSCDDGNLCTMDSCSSSEGCQYDPVSCDDGDPCTADNCDPVTGGCVHEALSCDDANACTSDSCNPGTGECENAEIACDDGVACTNDSCDPAVGCEYVPDDAVCDDGAFCNGLEACDPMAGCQAGDPIDCNDGIDCTADSCNEDSDSCDAAPDDLACDDGNACTDDSCAVDVGCQYANNTAECDDGDACTLDDSCNGGACLGYALDCDDGNVCTDDSCDPAAGCEWEENTASCDDGDACTQSDNCQAGACVGSDPVECIAVDQCYDPGSCDPATGLCSEPPKPDDTPCDDGDECTEDDMCVGGVCIGTDSGMCGGSPCAGFCADPVIFGQSFQAGPLGSEATCHETTAELQGGNCGNFAGGRQLFVNGTEMPCTYSNWSSLPEKVNGGYCITTTAGDYPWAYFTTW